MDEAAETTHEESTTAGRARDVTSELSRETDREILTILAGNSPLHVMDIASTVDRHPITVDQTCARLNANGQIQPVGRGVYDVTEAGKRRIGDSSTTES